jgi:hypothetical protein
MLPLGSAAKTYAGAHINMSAVTDKNQSNLPSTRWHPLSAHLELPFQTSRHWAATPQLFSRQRRAF